MYVRRKKDEMSVIQQLILVLNNVDKKLTEEKKPRTLHNRIKKASEIYKDQPLLSDLIIWLKNGYVEYDKEVVKEIRAFLLRQLNLIIYEEKHLQKTYLKYGLEDIKEKIKELNF